MSFFVQAQKTPASVSLYHYTLLFVFEQGERILNMKITLITVGKIKEIFIEMQLLNILNVFQDIAN